MGLPSSALSAGLAGILAGVAVAAASASALDEPAELALASVAVQAPTDRFQAVVEANLPGRDELRRAMSAAPKHIAFWECEGSGSKIGETIGTVRKGPNGTAAVELLLQGLTRAGTERYFTIARVPEESRPPPTDLSIAVSDGEIVASNTYFRVHHPRRGGGGFPADVEFRESGDRERFTFEDRVYDGNEGYCALRNDANSTATVVEQGPLTVVVEATGRYYDAPKQRYARGQARATYRYTYHAFSPVIEVQAVLQQDDDFAWPERHFLHLSRKDSVFAHWAGGHPLQTGDFTDSRTGRYLGAWGVMYNARDAAGLWAGEGVTLYDGVSEYFNYLKASFKEESRTRFTAEGRLYFGPARRDPDSIEELLAPTPMTVMVLSARPGARGPAEAPRPARDQVEVRRSAQTIDVASRSLVLSFVSPEAGGMGLRGIYSIAGRRQFLAGGESSPLLWRLELQGKDVEPVTLDNTAEAEREFDVVYGPDRRSARIHLHWSGLDLPGEPDALDVRVIAEANLDSALSQWRIYVDNRSRRYGLWNVHFPVIRGVAPPGTCDVAVPRSNWGMLYKDLKGRQTGSYPSANWPMQFVTVHAGWSGLYLAAQDPGARPKTFSLTPGGEFEFATWPENMGAAGSDYGGYYPCTIGVFEGDWATGCKLYRAWAVQAPWTRKGKLVDRSDVPDSLKRLGLWMQGGGTAEEVVPKMLQAKAFFGVPLGVHWYSWHEIPFDTHYPEYFPYKPGFPEGVRQLTQQGIVVMPYINGRLWDQGLPSFSERARPYCTKDRDLVPYTEVYPSQAKQAVMCPYTVFWQDTIADVVGRLVDECGCNAVYIDQIAAAGPELCFDPTHGHPLGGGTYWVDGYRELLRKVQVHADTRDAIITTENDAEPYMDGVDAFLIWNPRHPDEIPVVTTVYNDYTKYFASNTSLDGTLRAFMMVEGRDFIWGSQLGWMGFELLDPANRDKAAYLRRLGQYREATRKFLTFGELIGPVYPKLWVSTIREQWHGWSGEAFPAELPAAMASLWRAQDGSIGLFMVNLDTAPQEFSYRIHLAIVDRPEWGKTGIVLRRIAPEGTIPVDEAPDGTIEDELTLDPGEILVLEGRPPKPGEDLLGETVRAIHDAAEKAAPMPALPKANEARCDAAWRYLQGQRGRVEPGLWRAAAAFVAGEKSAAVGFDHGFLWGPPPIVPGEAAVVQGEFWNDGKRAIEYGFSRSGSEALGIESSGVGEWRRLAPGEQEKVSLSVTPSVPEGRAPVTGSYVDVLHFRTNDVVYDIPRRAILEVLPRTEATVELPPDGVRAGEPFAFQVHVNRNADWPMAECELHIDAPPEWEIIPGRRIPIDALERWRGGTIWVLCQLPEDAKTGDVRIGAEVVAAGAETSAHVQPPRPRVAAPRAQNAPNVDADLSEWTGAAIVLDGAPHVKIDGWGGPSDESTKAWVQWDQHNLYFAAEVTDDAFSQPYTNREVWQGDCIQMAFRPGAPPLEASYEGVTEVGLALTPEGPLLWQWFPEDRPLGAGAVAVQRRGQTTRYEASIPWQQLGAVGPDLPRLWAWSFTVNDRDGDQFRGWLEWTPGICGGKDASQFGILDLVG